MQAEWCPDRAVPQRPLASAGPVRTCCCRRKPGLAKGEDEVGGRSQPEMRGPGHSAQYQGPASPPGTGPGTWSMTSRAWPGTSCPSWGPALSPTPPSPLKLRRDRQPRVSGAQQTLLPRAACKAGELALTTSPWLGRTAWPLQVPRPHRLTLTHTHRVTPVVTSHPGPRTSEHTGTQSAHGPGRSDHRGLGSRSPPAWEGCDGRGH